MIFFGFWLSHVPPEKLADFLARVSAMLKPEGHLFMVDSRRNIYGTATNQRVPTDTHIHQRILNDGSQYQIVKVFYEPDALQSSLAQVNIAATAKLTDNFFIYAHGRKANS